MANDLVVEVLASGEPELFSDAPRENLLTNHSIFCGKTDDNTLRLNRHIDDEHNCGGGIELVPKEAKQLSLF